MLTRSGLEAAETYDLVQVFQTLDLYAQGISEDMAARTLGVSVEILRRRERRGRNELSDIFGLDFPNTIAVIARMVQIGWIRPD